MAEFGGSQIEVQKTVLKTYEQVVFFFFIRILLSVNFG